MEAVPKFDLKYLLGAGMTLIVLGVALAYGMDIVGDVQADFVTGGAGCNATSKVDCLASYNATVNTQDGISKIPEKLPTVTTILMAGVVLGMIVSFLYLRSR